MYILLAFQPPKKHLTTNIEPELKKIEKKCAKNIKKSSEKLIQ